MGVKLGKGPIDAELAKAVGVMVLAAKHADDGYLAVAAATVDIAIAKLAAVRDSMNEFANEPDLRLVPKSAVEALVDALALSAFTGGDDAKAGKGDG